MDQQEVLDLIEIIGLKKNHAATAAGIPTPRFSEWLHDKRPLTARQMQRLTDYFSTFTPIMDSLRG